MQDILTSIAVTLVGFILGGIILTIIGAFSIKFFVKRIVKELTTETKESFSRWVEDVLLKSIERSLKDKKVKKLVIETLSLALEKIEKSK